MNMKKALATIAVLLPLSALAIEEKDTRTPLEAFEGDTKLALLMCSMRFKTNQLEAELIENGGSLPSKDEKPSGSYRECIKTNLSDIAPLYKRAAAKVQKKPAAASALKSYYAAWIAALKGISPSIEEKRLVYEARQSAAENRLNELWATVEIEAQ